MTIRTRNQMIVFAAVMFGLVFAIVAGGATHEKNQAGTVVRTAMPITSARVMFSSASTDNSGTWVADPYAWSGITAASSNTADGGRLLTIPKAATYLEFQPYFTTAGASATIQIIGFDFVAFGDVGANTNSLKPFGSDFPDLRLGVPHHLAIENGATTFIATATAAVFKFTKVGDVVVADQTNGTTYYMAKPIKFDWQYPAYLVIVNNITAGTLVVTGQTISTP